MDVVVAALAAAVGEDIVVAVVVRMTAQKEKEAHIVVTKEKEVDIVVTLVALVAIVVVLTTVV